jgi:hypothetical protein
LGLSLGILRAPASFRQVTRVLLQLSGTLILAVSKRVTFLIRRNEFFYALRHNSTGIRDIVREIVLRK